MKYNLLTSQADRANFDESIVIFVENILDTMGFSVMHYILDSTDEVIALAYLPQINFGDVDDEEEAKARYMAVFKGTISEARCEIIASEFGLDEPNICNW